MGQMKKILTLSGKPSFTPTVVRGATSNSMRCSRFSLSQSFALRLCFSEANPTTTLLLMRTATATSPPSCYLTKASLACKAPAQILEVITTPNLLADADRHCLLVRCLSALNHAPNAHQSQCATAGAPRYQTTTFLKHHAGHGRTDLSAIQNLPAESGWTAEHAFATGQESWEAKCILVAPTAFRTAMSKMQATNQLPMPADDSADSANGLPMPAFLPVQPPPLHVSTLHSSPAQLPAATQLPPPAAAPVSKFQEGDLFTLKSNTRVTSFGTCWVARQDNRRT